MYIASKRHKRSLKKLQQRYRPMLEGRLAERAQAIRDAQNLRKMTGRGWWVVKVESTPKGFPEGRYFVISSYVMTTKPPFKKTPYHVVGKY